MQPSLERRLYQLIISRLDGSQIQSPAYRGKIFGLVKKGIGGFILFGGDREEIRAFIHQIQSMSEIPLFIASDIERGVGQQVKGCTPFPCQMAVRAAIHQDRPEEVAILREAVRGLAHEAIHIGINMPLIPVLDVNQDPDNPIICTRGFSDDPEVVSWFGVEYIKVLEGSGLLSCAKHFPGHGDTHVDSHISLPVIQKSLPELTGMDLWPFKEAIGAGVSSIMVGHLQIPALDAMPASLSGKVIRDLLREELGFKGLVLTDALNMSALSGIDHAPARCIAAGGDVLLHPVDADAVVRELREAIESGVIDEGGVDSAIGRILEAKGRLRRLHKAEVDYHNNDILSKRITEMSMTCVKHKTGILPITEDSKAHLVVVGEEKFYEPSLWEELVDSCHAEFGSASPYGDHFETLKQVQGDILIFALFTEVAAWKGSSGVGEVERRQIAEIIRNARKSVVISFGNPYVLRHFREADILIAAYEATEQAQEAVIKCLKGEREFRGELPVNVCLSP